MPLSLPSLLSLLLLVLSSRARAGVPTRMPKDAVKGRTLYEDHCWQCHGPEGRGDGPLADAFDGRPLDLRGKPELVWPDLVAIVQQGRGEMPAFAEVMDAHDSRRILVWLDELDGDELARDLRPTRGHAADAEPQHKAGGAAGGDAGSTRPRPAAGETPPRDTPPSPDVSTEAAG